MKVKDIKAGEIFVTDNTIARPKFKLQKGFLDMITRYIYINRGNEDARILTETDFKRIRHDWGMTPEKFEDYKQMLVRKHIEETVNKEDGR